MLGRRQQMPTLRENLAEAESAAHQAQAVKPDAKELKAIKDFCAEEVARRALTAEASANLKALRATQKDVKGALLKALKEASVLQMAISKDDAARLDAEAAARGLPSMPRYLRLVQTNKDATITAEVIQESLEGLSLNDISEATKGPAEPVLAVKEAVLQALRRAIRSYTESARLMTSLPRGTDVYEALTAPESVVTLMWTLWTNERQIKNVLETKKVDPEVAKHQISLKETIEAYFVRTGLTAQRLVVEGRPYRLVRRVSVRKPKVGIGKLQAMLDVALKDMDLSAFRPLDLIRALQVQLANIEPESKSSVSLCSVKAPSEQSSDAL